MERHRPLTVGTEARDGRGQRQQDGDHVCGGRGVDDVASDGRHVPDLVSPDNLRALDERAQRALEGWRAFEAAMRDQRADPDRPVDVDGIESGHAMEADDVPWRAPAAMDLNHEIGPAGEKTTPLAEPRAQLDGLPNRRGLVVVKAHLFRHHGKVCVKIYARKRHLPHQSCSPDGRVLTRQGVYATGGNPSKSCHSTSQSSRGRL